MREGARGINSRHALQEMFYWRLDRGKLWHTPCLGWKEFVPSYIGRFRESTCVDETIGETIPSMLISPHTADVRGKSGARFAQNVKIEKGVLRYDQCTPTVEPIFRMQQNYYSCSAPMD